MLSFSRGMVYLVSDGLNEMRLTLNVIYLLILLKATNFWNSFNLENIKILVKAKNAGESISNWAYFLY